MFSWINAGILTTFEHGVFASSGGVDVLRVFNLSGRFVRRVSNLSGRFDHRVSNLSGRFVLPDWFSGLLVPQISSEGVK